MKEPYHYFNLIYSQSRVTRLLKLTALIQIWTYKRITGGYSKSGTTRLGEYLDQLEYLIDEIQTARRKHGERIAEAKAEKKSVC